jgi:hypothetical protein
MATSVLLVIAIGLFVGLVVIPHLHFIAVAIAHVFHPHVFGVVAGAIAVMVLLLALLGFFWVAPARVMAPAQPVAVRAEPVRASVVHANRDFEAVMEVHDAATTTKAPQALTMAEYQVTTWAKLVLVTVILLGIAAVVALLANPHFRAFLHSRPAAIILAACAMLFVLFLFAARVSYHEERTVTEARSPEAVTSHPPTRPQAERGPLEPKVDRATDAASVTAERTEVDPASLPDWVHREPSRGDDPYYVVARSGDFTDAFARDEMLSAQMVNAADRYIREVRPAAFADAVKFEPAYLRSSYLDAQYPPAGSGAAGEETFVRLKFDSRFRDEVDHRWREFVSSDRLEKLSGYSAVGLALLGVVYIYLRATSPKQAS